MSIGYGNPHVYRTYVLFVKQKNTKHKICALGILQLIENMALYTHKDVSTTMIYTHVLNKGGKAVRSPLDEAGHEALAASADSPTNEIASSLRSLQ